MNETSPQKLCDIQFIFTVDENNILRRKDQYKDTACPCQRLNFTNLNINNIQKDSFHNCQQVIELNLSGNNLTILDLEILKPMQDNIKKIILDSNSFEIFPSHCASLSSLESISIANNALRFIPTFPSSNLLVLEINNNNIIEIASNTFKTLTNLTSLLLNENKLKRVPQGVAELKELSVLDLENNNISTIRTDDFRGCSKLIELSLKGNKLSQLPVGAFSSLQRLKVLRLSDNNFSE
eukprot:Pgem_evm1s6483